MSYTTIIPSWSPWARGISRRAGVHGISRRRSVGVNVIAKPFFCFEYVRRCSWMTAFRLSIALALRCVLIREATCVRTLRHHGKADGAARHQEKTAKRCRIGSPVRSARWRRRSPSLLLSFDLLSDRLLIFLLPPLLDPLPVAGRLWTYHAARPLDLILAPLKRRSYRSKGDPESVITENATPYRPSGEPVRE